MADGHRHTPVVRRDAAASESLGQSRHYIVCATCGLLIDFRVLEGIGFKTDDWIEMPDLIDRSEVRDG